MNFRSPYGNYGAGARRQNYQRSPYTSGATSYGTQNAGGQWAQRPGGAQGGNVVGRGATGQIGNVGEMSGYRYMGGYGQPQFQQPAWGQMPFGAMGMGIQQPPPQQQQQQSPYGAMGMMGAMGINPQAQQQLMFQAFAPQLAQMLGMSLPALGYTTGQSPSLGFQPWPKEDENA